jgi:hypothetical protein
MCPRQILARPPLFAALRPAPGRAPEVIAPPYDVLNTEEARVLAEGRPWSFLHISKPEIDLPAGTDPYAPQVYAKAAENLKKMLDAGVLQRDEQACYYAYRLIMGEHVAGGPGGGGQRGGLRHQPHPQARIHAPRQGRRPGAPDRGPERPDRPGAAGLSPSAGSGQHPGRRHPAGAGCRRRGRGRERRRRAPHPVGDPGCRRHRPPHRVVRCHAGPVYRRRPPPFRRRIPCARGAQGGQPRPWGRRGLQLLPVGDLPPSPDAHHGLQPGHQGSERPVRARVHGQGGRALHDRNGRTRP